MGNGRCSAVNGMRSITIGLKWRILWAIPKVSNKMVTLVCFLRFNHKLYIGGDIKKKIIIVYESVLLEQDASVSLFTFNSKLGVCVCLGFFLEISGEFSQFFIMILLPLCQNYKKPMTTRSYR